MVNILFRNENCCELSEYEKVGAARPVRIKYLKHSKIIVGCEAIAFYEDCPLRP